MNLRMQEANFSVVPEGCISNILSFTSPRDACRSSLVACSLKNAADSDVMWEKFLPSDYKEIVSRSASPLDLNGFESKKELYFHLCADPILLDGGVMSFNLEKKSGKKCFMIGAKKLHITWGDTPDYWTWTHEPDSRFAEVAELVYVWWLEIRGKIDTRMLSPKTTYGAYLVFKIKDNEFGGYNQWPPADVSVKFVEAGSGASDDQIAYLDPTQRPVNAPNGEVPSMRRDGWMEIKLGQLYNDHGEDGEVEMSLMEVKAGVVKEGLVVVGIENSNFYLISQAQPCVIAIYLLICNENSVNLEKRSGKKCFMIGAKELEITWSDTPQYWKWIPLPDSRVNIDTQILKETTYAAYLATHTICTPTSWADTLKVWSHTQ
ncbi:hypothetical protein IFM89_027502 [Coptis chinensis]|uniref:Uncharacterized protein n=1 Tax=Coptis chinensis TaxID=261450 RepID=A0A835I8G1_9MAGN|nr:hypothetical protein IFM89_027502 [Coptis chinensis]